MSLAGTLVRKLAQPWVAGAVVECAQGADRFVARVDQVGSLALSLWELRLETDRLARAPMQRVRTVAEELTRRVTYLLEPIQPIEADAEACVVQLRSTKPDTRAGVATYYEVLVRPGGSIALNRYEKPPGALRREAPMHLTLEVIERLADDFLASVA